MPQPIGNALQADTRIHSEGQRRLRMIQESDSAVARRLGKSRITASSYRTGKSKPMLDTRKLIEEYYGIPVVAWDLMPEKPSLVPRSQQGEAHAEIEQPLSQPDSVSFIDALDDRAVAKYGAQKTSAPLPSTREGVEALLRRLRSAAAVGDLLPSDRVKLATAESRAWAQLERMDKENQMSEDRVIKQHPKWKKLKKAIVEALVPFPEAARAVLGALRALEMEEGT